MPASAQVLVLMQCCPSDSSFIWAQIQLHPHHLPLLVHLSSCLGDSAQLSAAAAAAGDGEATQHTQHSPAASADATAEPMPAARSIIEGMLLPDTTAFATAFMSQSWAYGRASRHDSVPDQASDPSSQYMMMPDCIPCLAYIPGYANQQVQHTIA